MQRKRVHVYLFGPEQPQICPSSCDADPVMWSAQSCPEYALRLARWISPNRYWRHAITSIFSSLLFKSGLVMVYLVYLN
jgi:ABC-type multidrug transport system permease subunit